MTDGTHEDEASTAASASELSGLVMWKRMISAMTPHHQKYTLARVLRTRKRFLDFHFNGRTQFVPRAEVRDYLKAMHPEVKKHYA